MTQTQALTRQKANTIRALLGQDSVKQQLGMAIPKHLSVDRLLRVAMTSIHRSPKLLDCTPKSLLSCVMTCAQLGLEPDGFTGQAYLVPFKNRGTLEAQLIPGYRGYLALARRSGELKSVQAQVVYDNDVFQLQYGLEERLEHLPADGDRGAPKGAYCVFRYKDGGYSFDYMSAADIEKIRARSKSPDNGPWVTDWAEMAKKTVIRRHVKLAPISVEFQTAAALEDRFHAGETQMDIMGGNGDGDGGDEPVDVDFEEGGSTRDTAAFDALVSEVEIPDDGSLPEFISVVADANGSSVDEVKVAAARDFEAFMAAYSGWRKKNRPAPANDAGPPEEDPTPPKGNGRRKRKPRESGKSEPQEQMVECPRDEDTKMKASYCESDCPDRPGCPAWEGGDPPAASPLPRGGNGGEAGLNQIKNLIRSQITEHQPDGTTWRQAMEWMEEAFGRDINGLDVATAKKVIAELEKGKDSSFVRHLGG